MLHERVLNLYLGFDVFERYWVAVLATRSYTPSRPKIISKEYWSAKKTMVSYLKQNQNLGNYEAWKKHKADYIRNIKRVQEIVANTKPEMEICTSDEFPFQQLLMIPSFK